MSYPKWIYHKTQEPKIVTSEAEHAKAGNGWEETPAAFDKKSDEKTEKSAGDQAESEQIKAPIKEADFTKMKIADLKAYLFEKGIAEEQFKDLKKDELIALIGKL